MFAEIPNGEHVAIPVNDESLELMQCTSTDPTQKSEVFEVDVDYPQCQGADIADGYLYYLPKMLREATISAQC